jgi:hypothetical protein
LASTLLFTRPTLVSRRRNAVLHKRFLTLILTIGLMLGFTAVPAMAAEPMAPGTWGPGKWTGYVKEWPSADPYTGYYSIHAEWKVPKVACPPVSYATDYRVGFWVGLNGFRRANPFAQTGIGVWCRDGQPIYKAWREYISGMFGQNKPPHELSINWPTAQFPVFPGDTIIADVVYENGTSLVRLHNPGRWQGPAEERLAVPRFAYQRIGPFFWTVPSPRPA